MKKIVVTLPNLQIPGGVSAFWNAILPEFSHHKEHTIQPLEIGGHGRNLLALFLDQKKVNNAANKADLVVLNPSLGSRSFFRDGLFAYQIAAKKVPFVVFFHGWDLVFEKKVTKKYTSFFRNTLGRAACIMVLSKSFKSKLREWGYKGPVVVGTTAIDAGLLRSYSPEQKLRKLQSTENIKIIFLSRLIKEKGIYETIGAFLELQKSYPKIELIIAGDGSEYDKVVDYIESTEGIVLTGHIQGVTKIAVLEEGHIFCLPSYTEGLPTVVLEAMAFGMPVITTAVGGLKDFIKPQMGLFANLETPLDLAQKMDQLLSDKSKMTQIGLFNHQYAKENLLAPVVAQKLMEQFIKVMDEAKNKSSIN